MKDNQKTKKQLIDELGMLRQKVAALEIAGSQPVATDLRDASKAQQEDNAAKPKRKESRSFQEEKLSFIIEQAGLTSWDWDIEHDRKVFNAIWAEKLGYTLEEFNSALQESSLDHFQHPEDLPAAQQAMKDCLTGKAPLYRAEYRMRTKTGDWKWMLALGKIIERNAEGKPTLMTGVNLDITERKRMEEALRESEAKYRALLEAIPDKIIHFRKDGTHLAVKMPSDYIATTQYDLDTRPNISQINPEMAPRVLSCLQQAVETSKTQVLEYEAMRGDEKEYREARYTAINQDEIVAIIRDITGRKRAEEALRESEERFRTLVENIPGEVYRCLPTPPWRIIHNSAKNETIIGYLVSDFLEGSLLYSDFILSEDLEMVNSALEAGIACKKPYIVEYRIHHADGSPHWVAERGRAVYSEQGEPLWLDGVIFDITGHKRAEEALRESETQYRELFNNISSGVAIYEVRDSGNDFIFKDFNKAGERIDGDRKEDVLGKSIFEVRPGIKEFGLLDVFKRVWKTGVPEHFSAQIYQDNRLYGWHENYVYILPSGEIVAVYDNVTENKLAEQALRTSENKYRLLVDNANEAIFVVQDSMLKFANRMTCEISGYTEQELTSMPFPMFIHPDDRDMVVERHLRRLKGGVFQSRYPFRLITSDGSVKWVEIGAVLIDWEGKSATLNFISDITERKLAEEALRQAHERLQATLNALPDLMFEIDREGRFYDYRSPHKDLLYVSPEVFLGKTVSQVLPKEAAEIINHAIAQAVEEGRHSGATYFIETPAGLHWFELSIASKGDPNAPDGRLIVLAHDITERKLAEQALLESEGRYHLVTDNTADAIWLTDMNLKTTYTSPSAVRMRGYTLEELNAMTLDQHMTPASLNIVLQALGEELTPEKLVQPDLQISRTMELEYYRKDGSVFWSECTFTLVRDGAGNPIGILGVGRDITERKRVEDALRESERSYRTLVENVPGAVYRCEPVPPWRIIHISSEIEVISGFPVRDFLDNTILFDNFEFPEDIEMVNRAILTGIADKKPYVIEYRIRHVDGSIRWLYEKGRAIYSEQGQPLWLDGVFLDITERKLAEEALQQANERLQATLNALPDLMFEVDREGHYYDYRAPHKDLLYVSPEVFLGKTVSQVLPKEAAEIINHAIAQAVEKGWHRGATYSLEVPAGLNWFELSIASKGDPKAPDGRLIALAHDITERKRAEEALRESEERYRSLFNRMLDGIYRSTHEGKFVDVNPAMVRMFGYSSKEEILEVDIKNELYFAPEERGSHFLDTGQEKIEIYRMRRKDGSEIWVEDHGHYVHDELGRVIYHEGMMRDITERKQAEEALRESENYFHALFEYAPIPIWEEDFSEVKAHLDHLRTTGVQDFRVFFESHPEQIATLAGLVKILNVNQKSLEFFEIGSKEEMITHLSHYFTEESLIVFKEEIITLAEGKTQFDCEIPNRALNGEIKILSLHLRVTPGFEQTLSKVLISFIDLTERKKVEQALRESEERFRTLLENIPGAVYRCEPTPPWRTTHISSEIEAISGFPARDFLEDFSHFELPEDFEMVYKALETNIASRQPYTLEYRLRHADGSIRWVYEKGRAIYSEQGQPLWLDGVLLDITERKRAEEALREAQKLASIGTLAGGMAHEINSPLQVVTGITERIAAQLESGQLDEGKLKRDIATVNRCGWNIANIVRSVLTYVRESPGQVASHNLNEIVKDTLLLTEHQLKTWSNISVLSDLGRNLPPLSCERSQIVQVLINLLTNARDAMPNGGEITIRTRYNAKQNRFTVQVSDTGTGIPKEIQTKIFDPFFTTKEVGQGTGLGLSIVFGIVKAHGGDIKVESAPKQGTTFTIYLPKEPIQKPDSEPRAENQGRY